MLYADDTCIIISDNDLETLSEKNVATLRKTSQLFFINKLTIYETKNQNILFTL